MEGLKSTGKQSVRSKYLAYRDRLTKNERLSKSMKIWENLKKEPSFKEADVVLVYLDYRSEVMTTGLVEELLLSEGGKRVFAPRVEGLDVEFYEIYSLTDLRPGYQGIREPEVNEEKLFTKQLADENKCVLLLPGSVYDRALGRMGYGKGFYDRFIHKFPNLTKAGLAFDCQIAKQVPVDEHDKRVDMVVTETEVIK
ncbi:MAG: 5-formyltetrahydrofolate cyclo-ligase [Lachnospiraceae bacterium]|nr:5-formyltetrahydrofolate cyclo-ligase [Lachnospiraceae bacterium]